MEVQTINIQSATYKMCRICGALYTDNNPEIPRNNQDILY